MVKLPVVALLSGIGLELASDETMSITAAHAVGTVDRQHQVVWIKQGSGRLFTAQLDKAMADLEAELAQNIRPALEAFTNLVEKTYAK